VLFWTFCCLFVQKRNRVGHAFSLDWLMDGLVIKPSHSHTSIVNVSSPFPQKVDEPQEFKWALIGRRRRRKKNKWRLMMSRGPVEPPGWNVQHNPRV
jgi:hypothetical protein